MCSGRNIDLRKDRWLTSGNLGRINEHCHVTKVAECINSSGTGWDLQTLGHVLDHDSSMDAIKTPISIVGGCDSFWWPHSSNGSYYVKSGYYVAHRASSLSPKLASSSLVIPKEFWCEVWRSKVPQKIQLFIWKLCHNALLVKRNLFNRKLNPCPICNNYGETVEHVFLLCNWVCLV